MNSGGGFVGFFDGIFGDAKRLYIIKGGPGTGKSRLMRDFAIEAENRGYDCELFYCSSDSTSLDGVLVPTLGIGILDGTAPHVWEPKLPGVREQLINLGEFWNTDLLYDDREAIESINELKRSAYDSAYRLLRAAREIGREAHKVFEDALLCGKLDAAVGRITAKWHPTDKAKPERIRQHTAMSAQGRVTLDCVGMCARERLYVDGGDIASGYVMDALYGAAREKNVSRVISYEPISGGIRSLYLDEVGVLFTSEPTFADRCTGRLNSRRFTDNEILRERRGQLRFLKKCADEMADAALGKLSEAGKLHAGLEEIYGAAMDFPKKQRYCREVVKRIFG